MGKSTRIKEIEAILDDNFGANSTERVEDLLDERDKLLQIAGCPLCNDAQSEEYKPYCSASCQTHDNLLC